MKKILIIDDDEDFLILLKHVLINQGYEVFTRPNGQNILQVLIKFYPDLILLDIMLPRKSGIVICNLIKGNSDIPVILFSSNAKQLQKTLEFHTDGYLHKPFVMSKLIDMIGLHMDYRKN